MSIYLFLYRNKKIVKALPFLPLNDVKGDMVFLNRYN